MTDVALTLGALEEAAREVACRHPGEWKADGERPATSAEVRYRFRPYGGANGGPRRGWLDRGTTRLFWVTVVGREASAEDLNRMLATLNHTEHRCPIAAFSDWCHCCGENFEDGDWVAHLEKRQREADVLLEDDVFITLIRRQEDGTEPVDTEGAANG